MLTSAGCTYAIIIKLMFFRSALGTLAIFIKIVQPLVTRVTEAHSFNFKVMLTAAKGTYAVFVKLVEVYTALSTLAVHDLGMEVFVTHIAATILRINVVCLDNRLKGQRVPGIAVNNGM